MSDAPTPGPDDTRLPPASADLAREGAAGAGGASRAAGETAGGGATPLWKRLLPFVLAVVLLGVVFSRMDVAAARAALGTVNAPAFVAFAAGFLAALLSADVFATLIVYRPVLGRIRYRDLMTVRGASYLASLLNHHV